MVEYTEEGIFYFVLDRESDGYHFYYQSYDSTEPIHICTVSDGIVNDFSGVTINGQNHLSILVTDGHTSILNYSETGTLMEEITLDDHSSELSDATVEFLALQNNDYALGSGEYVYLFSSTGQYLKSVKIEGIVRELYQNEESSIYVLVEDTGKGDYSFELVKLDPINGQILASSEAPNGVLSVFPFEDGFVTIYDDAVRFSHFDTEESITLIDMIQQSLLASEIKFISGSRSEIRLLSVGDDGIGYAITLAASEKEQEDENLPKPDEDIYTSDGRRILHVAVPRDYVYQIEFHTKKYNQICEDYYVEVERFEDTLEYYLGKGKRPDIIMFSDHTELDEYVKKGALVDFLPFFDNQNLYSLDGISQKVKELLGNGDINHMYGMTGKFRLLLRITGGSEYDENGSCFSSQYLKWYDAFLTEKEIAGMGSLENLLYANVGFFYDEESAKATFTSEEFKALMQKYKEVYSKHNGSIEYSSIMSERDSGIANGPRWYASYRYSGAVDPSVKTAGIPGIDGNDYVYMRLENPMSILSTSDCQEAAFDFIMYYNSQYELLMKGDLEGSYGKSGTTYAIFSAYEEYMNRDIYESEKPYVTFDNVEYYFTDEQSATLKEHIMSAIPETKTQKVIYKMLMEEMEPYILGEKELDTVCNILQGRVELYLNERK